MKIKIVKKCGAMFISSLILSSCSISEPSYCECSDMSKALILKSTGVETDVEWADLEDCAEKVKRDIDWERGVDDLPVDLIDQVTYEMCKYGYYEGKLGDRRGKKFYPK